MTGILPIDNMSLSSVYLKMSRDGESVQSAKDKAESVSLNPELNNVSEVNADQNHIDLYA